MRRSRLRASCALLLVFATTASAQTKALRFASVVTGDGRVVAHGVVIVDGDKIASVIGPDAPMPAGAQVQAVSSLGARIDSR